MIYILIAIYLVVFFFALLEERLQLYSKTIYVVLGVVLVLYAGFGPIGFSSDSGVYETIYVHYDNPLYLLSVEYSYLFISRILNTFSSDVHLLFLMYALAGISLKMCAIKRLSDMWFVPMLVYIGNYYILHDLVQIRASIVSGLFFLSIRPLAEGRRRRVALILFIATLFHYSALSLFPVLFLSNHGMTKNRRLVWSLIVPAGYIIAFVGINFIGEIPLPYIGDKLASYQQQSESGGKGSEINIFNAVFLVKCLMYFYMLYFYDTVIEHNKYLPILLRIMGVSIFCFLFFSFLPVLSYRISELYGIVEVLFYSFVLYTVKPGWVGKCVVGIVGLALLLIGTYSSHYLNP